MVKLPIKSMPIEINSQRTAENADRFLREKLQKNCC